MNKSLCTLCGKGFSRIQALKRHVLGVHEGKKPYACPTCDKRFSLKCVMTSHVVAVHEKAKPFTCTSCNLSFSRRHHLKTHIAKVHESPYEFRNVWKYSCFDKVEKIQRISQWFYGSETKTIRIWG